MRKAHWTTKELAILKEYYPTGGTKAVMERIARSSDAIRQAARKYGLKADKSLYQPPLNYYAQRNLRNELLKRGN